MNSLMRRYQLIFFRWGSYMLVLLILAALQTTPGFLTIGAVKPLLILPFCLAVAMVEDTADAAFFGALGGLLWDFTSARMVGLFAIGLLLSCMGASLLVRMYIRVTPRNFILIAAGFCLLICSMDFLFNYAMPGYGGQRQQFLYVVLPIVAFSAVLSPISYKLVQRISKKFAIEE